MLKGVNWIAVIVAVVVLEVIGYLWYGMLFMKPWTDAMTAAGQAPDSADTSALMAIGVVNTLVIVLGLSWLTRRLGATSLAASVSVALAAWFFFDLTTQALEYLYMGMPATVMEINIGYQLVSYVLAGAILALVRFGAPQTAAA
jgi:hypothetical protein